MIEPESINPQSLPSLPFERRGSLPEHSAVYFVLQDDRILYIGRTVNLMKRWRSHPRKYQFKDTTSAIKIAWLKCSDPKLLPSIEIALIHFFKPEFNESLPGSNTKLAKLRTRAGLTQIKVANAIGVTETTISSWERGLHVPALSFKQTQTLCRILQCTLDDLVEATKKGKEAEE